jgi:tetratricopeptide (TPR) repeat protein
MFEFGRELRRIFNAHERIGTDPSLFELFNLEMLIAHGRALDIDAGRVSAQDPFSLYLEASDVWSEYARRTGDPIALKRAATSAEHAGRAAKSVGQATQAALAQAKTCLYTLDLYNSIDLMTSAEKLIEQCRPATSSHTYLAQPLQAVEAMLLSKRAARSAIDGDLEIALKAMSHIDRAIAAADQAVKRQNTSSNRLMAAHIRFERADILTLVALNRGDSAIFSAIISVFKALLARLDHATEPLTYGRVALRLGLAYIHSGQIEANAQKVNEGVALLSRDEAVVEFDHAPLDYIAHKQALAIGMQAIGALMANEAALDQALGLFDLALKKLPHKALCVRHDLYHQRLSLLVHKAEIACDRHSLHDVETQLKADIRALNPSNEPVFWAILQINLAHLYIVRGDLSGIMMERNEAIYALCAALEIFEENGLVALTGQAQTWLTRLKA